jgi:hypothetical protein
LKTLARLQDREELFERLRSVGPGTARRWGRMSAHQMICHLHDVFRMAIGEQPVSLVNSAMGRTVIKWIALYAPLPWPGGRFRTSPELDQSAPRGATPPVEFAMDVDRLVRMMNRVTADQRDFAWAPHPLFGPMSDAAWLRWGYLHTDHHLRQFGA